jgi:endonuclease YncB( thermonuclease family)
LFALGAPPCGAEKITAKVIGVVDGDTLRLELTDKMKLTVHLYGVRCPVPGQPFQSESAKFVFDNAFKRFVDVDTVDTSTEPAVYVTLLDGRSLNRALLTEGLAWPAPGDFMDRDEFKELQVQAWGAGKGLWSRPDPEPPWRYLEKKGESKERLPLPKPILRLIDDMEKADVRDPPARMFEYQYRGGPVYYMPSGCCSSAGELYGPDGNLLCTPSESDNDKPDDRCPDFLPERTGEKFVWEDWRL